MANEFDEWKGKVQLTIMMTFGDLCDRHLLYPVNDHKGRVKVMV